MARPSAEVTRDWAAFFVVLAARIYRTMLLTLAAIAIAPVLLTWQPFVIQSGSMQPSIEVGDVALGQPHDADDKVAVGRVYMYQDPSTGAERTMVHRIVERRDDGDFTTAGDANEVTDITPLPASNIEARAILLVPYVGKPVVWANTGQWVKLGLWLLLTVLAFFLASRNIPGEPPRWTMRRLVREALAKEKVAEEERESVFFRLAGAVAAALVLCFIGTAATAADATFTASSRNSQNSWTAGKWLLPYVQAVTNSNPGGFWLLDEQDGTTVTDRSGTYAGGRVIGNVQPGVAGALPNNPGTAFDFDGGRGILNDRAVGAPGAYTVEMWFRTGSNQLGYLAGFEDSTDTWSWRYDRTVLLDGNGRILVGEWGGWGGGPTLVAGGGYNDNRWHHLVVTAVPNGTRQNVVVYVDGRAVTSGQSGSAGSWSGHWRIGSGSTPGFIWPRTTSFDGAIDAVSIYGRAISAQEVAAHYAAR